MTNPLVLVADGDAKNLQILKENLEASGFMVITVANGNKAWEEIQRTPPKLILTEVNLEGLNGYQLLERLQTDPNTASIPLIFLTNQREIQQRVRAFEIGAKDYLIKPLHVKEVIAHIRMVLRRLERRKVEQFDAYVKFSGRLDQLSVADLIENFGVERKTGILTLSNGRRTGHVYFRDGAVVNASLGDFKQEAAVYQMFPWNRGYFNMVFRDIDVNDEISTTNLGLLLQGLKRLEIREKLISQLSSPRTAFVVTPTFKLLLEKKKVSGDVLSFIDLLDGKRDVEQIIDDSGLDDLITLKRIVRLYQQGFIKPTIPPAKKPVLPEKIEPISEPIRVIPAESPREVALPGEPIFADETLSEEEIFEVGPRDKRDELEKEIKPIFERIEKEKKQLLIPTEEKTDEPSPASPLETTSAEGEEYAEQDDTSIPMVPPEADLEFDADQTFIDEELIRERFGIPAIDHKQTEAEPEPEAPVDLPKQPTEEAPPAAPPKIVEQKPKIPAGVEKPDVPVIKKPDVKKAVTVEAGIKNKILVISVDDDCKDELMDILTNDNFESRAIAELGDLKIHFGRVRAEGFTQYQLIAVAVDKQFVPFIASLRRQIVGCLFAFDCSQPATWEYTGYLIQSLWSKFEIPYLVAVMNFHEQNSISLDVIRYQLQLAETVPLIAWDPVDRATIRELLSLVTKVPLRDKPRKNAEMLDSLVAKVMS
ncbi:MAG: response regulator [candidate division KSB1 bacterium]|nr:response regulator [candidate division KSB1 bacterium]MDZ7318745.1 response regulator [candidate division KSB1 bacterium]MDZ7340803.1 response regulator [candidate division KSB1 bacterium]